MGAPMLLVAAVLLPIGGSLAAVVPVAACGLTMMAGMGIFTPNRHGGH